MSIAEHIESDLRDHLEAGRSPVPLTLKALASHYEVSATPIRVVVERLVDAGMLLKKPNGRLQLTNEASEPSASGTFSLPSGPDDKYERILKDIVLCSLQPREVFIREESTARRHQLSRSAVREIFHRIAGQGFLRHVSRRGWKVRRFSEEDLHDYIEIRVLMELKALDLAQGKLRDSDLQAMLDGNVEPQHANESPRIDNRLHAYIIEASDNYYIQDFFARHAAFFRILFEWEGENREAAIEAIQQHHRILRAMLERDWAKARDALEHHLRHNHPVLAPGVHDQVRGLHV